MDNYYTNRYEKPQRNQPKATSSGINIKRATRGK